MAIILISFLGLAGQTSFSLEDMPWPPQQLFTKEGRNMAMVILTSLSELEGQTPSSLEAMTTSTALS